jgi:hypothetical protein
VSVLSNLSPGQRQLLMVGAPVVAGLALITVLRNRQSSPTAAAPVAANTDAIGVGQLASFESAITDTLNELAQRIDLQSHLADNATPAAPTPAAAVTVPAAATSSVVTSSGRSVLQVVANPFNPDQLAFYDPDPGGGTYYGLNSVPTGDLVPAAVAGLKTGALEKTAEPSVLLYKPPWEL